MPVACARRDFVAEQPVSVEATLNFLGAMAERAQSYTYDPPPGTPQSNLVYESHTVPIADLRPFAKALSLDREGFALVEAPTAVADLYDEAALSRDYYPEAERLVAEVSGARRVVVFDHTIRRRVPGVEDRASGLPRQPVPRVHNDYTVKSGPQRVLDLMGDEAEALLGRRFAIINVWRPIRGPLEDAPLAVCDAASLPFGDLAPQDLIYRDRIGEVYSVRYSPGQRWYYAPAMRRDEALLIKCYDSATDGTARFAPHSAFEDPTAPADKLPRESIELRTLAFFDAR